MQDKKILFSDLDGTLLKNDKSLSKSNLEAIKSMLKQGHYFVITTGRPVPAAMQIVNEIGADRKGCYLIAYNGAVIYDCSSKKVMFQKTLPLEHVAYLFQEAIRYKLHIQTYTKDHVITSCDTKELQYYSKSTNMPFQLVEDVIEMLETEPNKVLLASLDNRDILYQFQQDHLNWQRDKCNSFFTCNEFLEYCPKEISKGTALQYFIDLFDVNYENTFAVGDELNDIPMIEIAKKGIAMKNAKQEVKAVADYVLEFDNEQDGVKELIEEFIL